MPSIQSLYLFPIYQTREAYKAATGKNTPTWNPAKPIKSWEDPNPPTADEDGNVQYLALALGADKVHPAVGPSGTPYLRKYSISREDATQVNIPPKDFSHQTDRPDPGSLSPMAAIEVFIPCRELSLDEELFFAWGGRVEIRSKTKPIDPSNPSAPSPSSADLSEIRQLLLEVSTKLDIVLATRQQ